MARALVPSSGTGRRPRAYPPSVAPGDTTAPAGSDDDLAARLADPVLAGALADAPPPGDPPDVWGRLVDPSGAGAGPPLDAEAADARARDLLDRLSVHERLQLLSGDGTVVRGVRAMARDDEPAPYVAGAVPRLGLPGIRFSRRAAGRGGGPRHRLPGAHRPGRHLRPRPRGAGGRLPSASSAGRWGPTCSTGVCVDLLRHPAWGRAQETFGEDVHLRGRDGRGPGAGRPAPRDGLREAPRRHVDRGRALPARRAASTRTTCATSTCRRFRRCVEAGAAAVMTAYHRINGVHCGHHHHLVTEVLKDEWGFDGFVMSDFVLGVRSARAVAAGLDLEMPFRWRFRSLGRLVRQGRVAEARVDDAALRLLRQQVRFADRAARAERAEPGRYAPGGAWRATPTGRWPARWPSGRWCCCATSPSGWPPPARRPPRAAAEPVLPLDPGRVASLAVLGDLAARPVTGDRGPSHVRAPSVVTRARRAAGRRRALGHQRVPPPRRRPRRRRPGRRRGRRGRGGRRLDAARRGRERRCPGGGGAPRATGGADAPPEDESLIRTVAAANPRTVVVLVGGSAIVTESWREQVGAVLMAWYPGMEGGHAVARVLFGEVNPAVGCPAPGPGRPSSSRRSPGAAPTVRSARCTATGSCRRRAVARVPVRVRPVVHHVRARPARGQARRGTARCGSPSPSSTPGTRQGDEVVQVYLDEALGRTPARCARCGPSAGSRCPRAPW